MTTIAIDPGKSGGFAWRHGIGKPACMPMPQTEGEVLEELRLIRDNCEGTPTAIVEAVHAFPGQGACSMFTFGEGFGFLKGTLMALGYRIELVSPMKWQKALGIGATAKKDKKKQLLETAQRLHPNTKVTLKTADALLLLEYATTRPLLPISAAKGVNE